MFNRNEMDEAACSGTRVFYQAMPAVGADGKNIMKLIPVQMVNGQFVQIQTSKPKDHQTPKQPVTTNIVPTLQQAASAPPSTQQCLRNQFSHQNVLPCPVNPGLSISLNKHLPQQQAVTVPPAGISLTNSAASVHFLSQSSVSVTSPAHSKGLSPQIPLNTKDLTSELLSGVNKHTVTSPAIAALTSLLPSLPTTVNNQVIAPPYRPSCPPVKLLPKPSPQTSLGPSPKGAKPLLKLIPIVSERPNSPTKWVVEEVGSSAVSNAKASDSTSLTYSSPKTVTERENAEKHQNMDFKKSGLQSSTGTQRSTMPTKWVIEENYSAGLSVKPASSASVRIKPTAMMTSSDVKQQEAAGSQTRPGLRISCGADEVIDLCDDDTPDEAAQDAALPQTSAVPSSEDDNVIFVSYCPPKSKPSSTLDPVPKEQVAPVAEKDQSGLSNSTEAPILTEEENNLSTSILCEPNVSDATTSIHAGPNMENQQRISTPQPDDLGGDAKTESPADPNNTRRERFQTQNIEKPESPTSPPDAWTSPFEPTSSPMTDHQLRELFGITADVKVSLMRIDEVQSQSGLTHLTHASFKVVQQDEKPLRILLRRDICTPHEPNLQIEGTGDELLKNSHLNTKPPSASDQKCHSVHISCNRVSCETETQLLVGYMEPIDENFLKADKKHSQACLDLNTNTKRMGRTRKRTMCPCCSPATLDYGVKSSLKLQKCELTTKTKKRGGGQKLPAKDGQLSTKQNSPAKSKSNLKIHHSPAGNS